MFHNALCLAMYISEADVFSQLKHLLNVGLNVVPAMVALILTAYAILLTFIVSDKFKSIKEKKRKVTYNCVKFRFCSMFVYFFHHNHCDDCNVMCCKYGTTD